MKLRSTALIVSFLAASGSSMLFAAPRTKNRRTASADSLTVTTLKDARPQLHAPAYTAQERQLVADQAYFLLSNTYVHRDLKIKEFGPSADAIARLKDIKAKASSMNDDEFHTAMQLIFRDLHDHHTNYIAPLPLACSYVISPMSFRDVVENNQLKLVFQRLTRIGEQVPGEHHNAKPLDELVAVNGIPLKGQGSKAGSFIKDLLANSMGANTSAELVYGLMTHTVRNLSELPVPADDTIVYTLQDSAGKTYDIHANYYAIVNEPNCVKAAKKQLSEDLPPRVRFVRGEENTVVRDYKRFAEPEVIAPFSDDPLSEVGGIQDVKVSQGSLTYLRLESFMPENASVESIVQRIKEELIARRDSSLGLLIDIRQNGGGAIKLAEELTQLFTPAVIQPMPVSLLPTQVNLDMFVKSNGGSQNGWSQDVTTAMRSGARLTSPRVLTTPSEANRFGQVWFKPVVVMTDAACYSACDLFAAAMQDHAAATIVSAYPTTGAGGANVMDARYFRAVFAGGNNPFKALPEGQGMRVSWRQTVRTGKNAGKLIEDRGVLSDVRIPYTRADLSEKTPSVNFLSASARELLKLVPSYKSSIKLASSVRMNNGDTAHWSEQVAGVSSIDVMLDGKLVKSFPVTSNSRGGNVDIVLDGIKGNWENKRFDVVGKVSGKTAFRVVRELFWRGEEIKVTGSFQDQFEGNTPKYVKTFVSQGSQDDRWQVANHMLRVGKGPKYNSSVVTEAFMPLDLSNVNGNAVFFFNAALQSEDGMDIFSIIQRDTETGEEKYFTTLDGVFDMKDQLMGFPIDSNKKHVEMVFVFESDENWNMIGPIVRVMGVQTEAQASRTQQLNPLFNIIHRDF